MAGLVSIVPARIPDNVWDIDCTTLLDPAVGGIAIHGEYFNRRETRIYDLFRRILEGMDRSILIHSGRVPPSPSRVQMVAGPATGAAT